MNDRRELVEALLREVHFWLDLAARNRHDIGAAGERRARAESFLYAATLAADVPPISETNGFVSEVLEGGPIIEVAEERFARLAADHLYTLAEVPA